MEFHFCSENYLYPPAFLVCLPVGRAFYSSLERLCHPLIF
uniref:Uncharacterized protein n=1 Tax=Anguilla anguilla TaxID=7936 RepID=A0A0E9V258_ANGAN